MIVDFGFDLAGRREPRLWRGLCFGVAAALVETLPYVELCRVLVALVAGTAGLPLALEAAGVLLGCNLLLVVLKARANVETFAATYGLVADGRLAVADHLGRLPMGFFTQARRAALAELLAGRFGLYQDIVSQVWGLAIVNLALPFFLWCLLLATDWRLALVAGSLVPPALLAIPWSHRLLTRASGRLAESRDALVTGLVDQIEGLRELKQFDRQARCRQRLEAELAAFERLQMRSELAPAPALLAFGSLLQLGFAVTAMVGAWLVTEGAVGGEVLIVFLVVALRFYQAIQQLGINLAELRFARETLARIRTLAETPALPVPERSALPRDASVTFDAVCFAHDEAAGERTLEGICGHVPAGGMVALVGPSGSGKSTLAHLVARLWDVTAGAVRIGGVDVRALSPEVLNREVALVLQDVALFDGTIADNIRLGRPEASDEAVEAAARAAQAHDFVMRLPSAYETRIPGGEGPLSGGERQRLAIARALLKDAPILVLDEATASIDPENEFLIQRGLTALARERTLLVIAHRLWTVAAADEIWVLERGRIVQRGRHAELIEETTGLYHRLWTAQEGEHAWRGAAGD